MATLKQNQQLKLLQKISPQQIQFIKLLQVPTVSLEQRIKEEVEINPALDEGSGMGAYSDDDNDRGREERGTDDKGADNDLQKSLNDVYENTNRELNIEEYLANDAYDYRTQLPTKIADEDDDYEAPIIQTMSMYDMLMEQFSLLDLTDTERILGENIIGNIDEDGYLRRQLKGIVSDLAFRQGVSTTLQQAEYVLSQIQELDPPGIAARDLPECLILQLKRKNESKNNFIAIEIISKYFEDFSKKHFSKIRSKMGISETAMRDSYELIKKLNPKPGESQASGKHEYIVPDFLLSIEGNEIFIKLNSRNAPDLKVSRSYIKMYQDYKVMEKAAKDDKVKETLDFIKQKIDSAQWFIDAIKQRQYTLLYTMQSIAAKQKEFFLSDGEERKLRPMILKDIADEINMDISTVSRVANSKYVQTDFGIYPLKYFFTEGIETNEGLTVSNREVKATLEDIILNEDKQDPLSDDAITEMLNEKGYNIARRTVAKYREQLNIPVARLRKEV
ncbi:MAG: RNA polymerase factor sigma-54 [Bacteroidia bacterium]